MEYTILILILPLLSFLLLGLAGKAMPHKVAGTIGTLTLVAVTVLSYYAAIEYFAAGRDASGVFAETMPYNFHWLPLGDTLCIEHGKVYVYGIEHHFGADEQ